MNEEEKLNWIVLRTKSRGEKKLEKMLLDKGWEACCPCYSTLKQWSDRKKKVSIPLISSVVFVRLNNRDIHALYDFPLVSSIMKDQGKTALVRDIEIQNLKTLSQNWEEDLIQEETGHVYEKGDLVQVVSGKFTGLEGEFVNIQGKHKLLIAIKTIKMAFSILIPQSQIQKVNPK
jgi:transcription antitermination factor NusG